MIRKKQLQAALDRQAAGGNQLRLKQILINIKMVPTDKLQKVLAWVIAEEVLELFTWSSIRWDFIRGDPPLDVFDSKNLQAHVTLKPKHLTQKTEHQTTKL